jgi:hypothetical protein
MVRSHLATIEQRFAPRTRDQLYVAHKLRSALMALEETLAAVKRLEFRPMCHADESYLAQFVIQELHH